MLGHRGGRGPGWPAENTLGSFARAVDEGADGIELDVRLTADGVPVVFHDKSFARMTSDGDARALQRVTQRELPRLADGQRIPTLEDALDLMRGRIVNVELKTDVQPSSMLGEVPDRLRLVRASVAVAQRARAVSVRFSSFDPLAVVALSALAPRLPRALLIDTSTPRLATALPLALRRVVVAAHLHDSLCTPDRMARLAKAHLEIAAWTVNDAARATALAALGVQWLITDTPAVILSAVRPR